MSSNHRNQKRQSVTINGMLFDIQGRVLIACIVRNISVGGAQIELVTDFNLPTKFFLLLTRNGAVRRQCFKVWQFSKLTGVRFFSDPLR